MKQYITANRYKNQIYVREIVDGVEYRRKVRFQPYIFQRSSKPTEYKDFYGNQYVKKISFQNPFEMKEHIDMYKDIPGELWGNKDIVAQFMYDEKYDCFDFNNLIVSYLDIEVCTRSMGENGEWIDGGFPEASEAKFPINAICDYRSNTKKYHTFTTAKGWTMSKSQLKYSDEVEYIYCKDEEDLLKKWLSFWVKNTPHIMTGWNNKLFDTPYIINRLKILFGVDVASRISPFNVIESKEVSAGFGHKLQSYEIMGVAVLDYLDLYKKYRYTPREKYTLDFISRAENPEEHKLEFKGTHGSLYYDDPVFFVDYNIQDVRCVVNFEKKLQMIQLATYLSYFSNINFEDNFSPIKIWETIIAKSCLDEGIVIPMRFKTPEKKPYEGAYVHEPVPGLKGCIASFDYTSLYPKIMELFYIGADVHQTGEQKNVLFNKLLKVLESNDSEDCKKMLSEIKTTGIFNDFYINNDMPECVTKFLKQEGVSLTTNCEFYNVSKKSIFVSLITKLFLERKADKKTSFEYKHKKQDLQEMLKKEDFSKHSKDELEVLIEDADRNAQKYNVSQLVKKVLLNSLYGALGTEHFLLYTNEMARSITLMGQCLINKAAIEKNRFISKMLKEECMKDRRCYSDTDTTLYHSIIKINNEDKYIGEFYETSEGEEYKTVLGKYVKELPKGKYKTLSIDEEDLTKVKEVDILHAVKHKTSKHIWKIKVDGKEVGITEDHSIMILRDGYLMRGSVKDLREGDELLTINLEE